MVLVSVAGASSRAGKTALAETLLRSRPRQEAVAIKFTTTEDVFERCPRGTSCVVCDLAVPFRIITDPGVIGERGTDTARLSAAGAARVVWAIARRGAIEQAWQAVLERTKGADWLVMEGSTIVDLAQPDLAFFVLHPHLSPARWKPTTGSLLRRADAVVVNVTSARPPSPEVLAELARHRPGRPVLQADVTRPLAEWASDLDQRFRALVAMTSGSLSL